MILVHIRPCGLTLVAFRLWKMRRSGQFGTHRESGAQWIDWGVWGFSDSAIDAMGTTHAINGLDRHQDAGVFVYAFEFVKLSLKAIGPSDAFAKILLNYIMTQSRQNFAEKSIGLGTRLKKVSFRPQLLQISSRRGNNFRSMIVAGCG